MDRDKCIFETETNFTTDEALIDVLSNKSIGNVGTWKKLSESRPGGCSTAMEI
jgi:hypothetical protein